MHIRHASMLALLAGCGFHSSVLGDGDAAQIGDPIAMDSQSSASTANSMTLTWSHTVGPGLTRSLLVVGLRRPRPVLAGARACSNIAV